MQYVCTTYNILKTYIMHTQILAYMYDKNRKNIFCGFRNCVGYEIKVYK